MEKKDRKYVLYGAGKVGRAFLHLVGKNRISAFIDRNPDVNEVEGVSVIHSWTTENVERGGATIL